MDGAADVVTAIGAWILAFEKPITTSDLVGCSLSQSLRWTIEI